MQVSLFQNPKELPIFMKKLVAMNWLFYGQLFDFSQKIVTMVIYQNHVFIFFENHNYQS